MRLFLASLGLVLPLAGCALIRPPGPAAEPAPTSSPAPRLESVSQPPEGRYLFVELWVRVEGTGSLPRLMIDFPGYRFVPPTGARRPFGPGPGLSLTATDWGFVGQGTSRGGDAGGGAASSLKPIPRLPYTTTLGLFAGALSGSQETMRELPVILEAAAADGRLRVSIDGQRLVLGPGESWSRSVEASVMTPRYRGRYRVTSSLTNHGWHDRAQIARDT